MSYEGYGARPLDTRCRREGRGRLVVERGQYRFANQKSKTGISVVRGKRGGQTVKGSWTQDISP